MKRFLCIFLIFIINANTALAEEFARLYNIKDINTQRAEQIIQPTLNLTGYRKIAKNNFYLLENPALNIYTIIVLKPNGKDSYYYYLSNDSLDLNKKILKSFNESDFDKKRIRNSAFLTLFHSEASEFMSKNSSGIKAISTGKTEDIITLDIPQKPQDQIYDFSDEAQARFDGKTSAITPQSPTKNLQQPVIKLQKQNVLVGSLVHVEAGQEFNAVLSSTISSDSIANNDRISAQLGEDWIVNGVLIAPAGSIINGNVIDSRPATFAMGDGKIGMNFNQIITPDGKVIPLSTNEVYIVGDSPRALNIAKRTAGGAIGGLLLGALFLLGGADPAQALISGAAVGGAFGATSAVLTKGEDVHVPEGTVLQIMLSEPMTAQPYYEYN